MIKINGLDNTMSDKYEGLINRLLEQYDINVVKIEFVGNFTNTIFKVYSNNNECYAFRLATPGWRTYIDLSSEALWLKDLSEQSTITVPKPLFTTKGNAVSSILLDSGTTYYGLLMAWINGINLSEKLNIDNIYKMGELFANLHSFSTSYTPPSNFTNRKMDQVFAREEINNLFKKENLNLYTPEQLDLYQTISQIVDNGYKKLYKDLNGLIVINHDLHHENILVNEDGNLMAFDFEDTTFGYPIQDIAMAMKDLMEDVKAEDYLIFLDAFKNGYSKNRSWPEKYNGEIDVFIVGRMLWVANWVFENDIKNFKKHLVWTSLKFKEYLKTGNIRLR